MVANFLIAGGATLWPNWQTIQVMVKFRTGPSQVAPFGGQMTAKFATITLF